MCERAIRVTLSKGYSRTFPELAFRNVLRQTLSERSVNVNMTKTNYYTLKLRFELRFADVTYNLYDNL